MSIKDDKDDRKMLAIILLWAVIATIVFVYLASCCPCRNVVAPPPEVHYVHDTVKTKEVRDSIVYKDKIVKDSSSFTQRGDTIRIERWHWERDYSYEKILEARLDSFSNAEKDSIPYPVYIDKEVPAQFSKWQAFLITLGKGTLIIGMLSLLFLLIKKKFGL
jgi:hypothetical protein